MHNLSEGYLFMISPYWFPLFDVFDVVVFHVNSARDIAEITVKLADKKMVEELTSRIEG